MSQSAEKSSQIRRLDRLDQCFGHAIDMAEGIILDAEFLLRSLNKTGMKYPAEMAQVINRILRLAAENAESVHEMRNLVDR